MVCKLQLVIVIDTEFHSTHLQIYTSWEGLLETFPNSWMKEVHSDVPSLCQSLNEDPNCDSEMRGNVVMLFSNNLGTMLPAMNWKLLIPVHSFIFPWTERVLTKKQTLWLDWKFLAAQIEKALWSAKIKCLAMLIRSMFRVGRVRLSNLIVLYQLSSIVVAAPCSVLVPVVLVHCTKWMEYEGLHRNSSISSQINS